MGSAAGIASVGAASAGATAVTLGLRNEFNKRAAFLAESILAFPRLLTVVLFGAIGLGAGLAAGRALFDLRRAKTIDVERYSEGMNRDRNNCVPHLGKHLVPSPENGNRADMVR